MMSLTSTPFTITLPLNGIEITYNSNKDYFLISGQVEPSSYGLGDSPMGLLPQCRSLRNALSNLT